MKERCCERTIKKGVLALLKQRGCCSYEISEQSGRARDRAGCTGVDRCIPGLHFCVIWYTIL